MKRCQDCPQDATHGLYWWPKGRRWLVQKDNRASAPVVYCKWHATARAVQRNAEGVTPREVRARETAYA